MASPARTIASAVATAALLAAGLLALGVVLATWLGAVRVLPILSGSMSPVLPTGAVAIARPEPLGSVRPGMVIAFRMPTDDRRVVVHRVVSVVHSLDGTVVSTKGDANAARDPWRAVLHGRRVWVVQGGVPDVGYVALVVRRAWPVLAALAFVLLVVVPLGAKLWGGSRDREAACASPSVQS